MVAKEAGALKIIHGEDDQRGDEEELHVAHQVPRLAKAVTTTGDVGYGRYVCMTSAFRKEGVPLKQTKGREVAGSDWSYMRKLFRKICRRHLNTAPMYNIVSHHAYAHPSPTPRVLQE